MVPQIPIALCSRKIAAGVGRHVFSCLPCFGCKCIDRYAPLQYALLDDLMLVLRKVGRQAMRLHLGKLTFLYSQPVGPFNRHTT